MKVTLIQPPSLVAVDSYSTISTPPLGIAYLAAHARSLGYEVCVVDAVGEAVLQVVRWPRRRKRLLHGLSIEETVDRVPADSQVIGVSCMFTHAWPLVRDLIQALRRRFPSAKILTGGEHVNALPQLVLEQSDCDVCVLGEGEETLAELLAAFQSGSPQLSSVDGIAYRSPHGSMIKTRPRRRLADVDGLPWPAWDLVDPTVYMNASVYLGPTCGGRTMPMLASRGCPYRCTFCSSPNMWTQNWKARSPAAVVDEMESYVRKFAASDFQFQDLTAIVRKDWILAFCNEIMGRKLRITWSLPVGTRSEAVDDEVARALVASGCHHITYAPESGSQRILKSIQKKVDLAHLEASVQSTLAAGMKVCLFMIVGFPQETMQDIRQTLQWLRHMARVGVHEISVNTFVPLPGTESFAELSATRPFPLDDEFLFTCVGTSMLKVRSWNQSISPGQLLFLKHWALSQFYALAFWHHPAHLWRLITNALTGRQETKNDRLIHELAVKWRALQLNGSR